jgi:hypothetical protein
MLGIVLACALGGCASYQLGIGLPIGNVGGFGVSIGSDGSVGGTVGVGTGGVAVGVGGNGRLPRQADRPASAASAPVD